MAKVTNARLIKYLQKQPSNEEVAFETDNGDLWVPRITNMRLANIIVGVTIIPVETIDACDLD